MRRLRYIFFIKCVKMKKILQQMHEFMTAIRSVRLMRLQLIRYEIPFVENVELQSCIWL